MTTPLITCVEADFQRMADRIVEKAQKSDRFSKAMVLKIMAEVAAGPKHDWGAIVHAKTDHLYSQRASARLASPQRPAPSASEVDEVAAKAAQLRDLISQCLEAHFFRCILPVHPGWGAVHITTEAAKLKGVKINEVRLSHDVFRDDENGHPHLLEEFKPSREKDVLTVYSGIEAISSDALSALMFAVEKLGKDPKVLLVDCSAGRAIDNLPNGTRIHHLNRWIHLPVHGKPGRGTPKPGPLPQEAALLGQFLASDEGLCIVKASHQDRIHDDLRAMASHTGRPNIIFRDVRDLAHVINRSSGTPVLQSEYRPIENHMSVTVYIHLGVQNGKPLRDFVRALSAATLDANGAKAIILVGMDDTQVLNTTDLFGAYPPNFSINAGDAARALRSGKTPHLQRPDGHVVKITSMSDRDRDDLRIELRDATGGDLCGMEATLTRQDVRAIEAFLETPDAVIEVAEVLRFSHRDGLIDIHGQKSAWADRFLGVHPDDIRLALASQLSTKPDVEELARAQRVRFANGPKAKVHAK